MSRTKCILICISAMLSASAIAPFSALASTHNFKIEGTEIKEGEEVKGSGVTQPPPRPPVTGVYRGIFAGELIDDSRLYIVIGGIVYHQDCQNEISDIQFDNGLTEYQISGGPCQLFKTERMMQVEVHCVAKEAYSGKDKVVGKGEELLEAEAGKPFGELELTGKECAIAGTYKIEGTETCTIPEAQFEKVIHELICTQAGSALKNGTERAEFELFVPMKFNSGKQWSME